MTNDGMAVEVDVNEVSSLLGGVGKDFRLIDCREADEWDIGHIEGAELMPLSHFVEEAEMKLGDKSQHLIIYCHHGMRSLRAATWLRQQGFEKTQSMAGGIAAWSDYVDPEMPRY